MSHRFLFFMSLILAVLRNEVHVRLFSFCGYRKELANPLNSLIQQIIFIYYYKGLFKLWSVINIVMLCRV
ncbi:hypothetical protein Cva_01438 [Caedimonas varicaedens]|uniref:Uncharacterized protein n=1 Tax=Caedimonas varicaedens TaxID=1629334 RepID=A0A0K8MFV3_9PROT|nr:hypothetical protein Cva_01438 [Caedimonas varicaedens]